MRTVRLLVGVVVIGMLGSVRAEEKKADNAKLLLGNWELTKGETLPPGSTLEFTKDGKFTLTVTVEGKKMPIPGTYEVKGDSLNVTMKEGDKEHKETLKLKTLNDKELTVVDEKGKSDSFKRKG